MMVLKDLKKCLSPQASHPSAKISGDSQEFLHIKYIILVFCKG